MEKCVMTRTEYLLHIEQLYADEVIDDDAMDAMLLRANEYPEEVVQDGVHA